MNNSFHLANLRNLNIFIINDSYCSFLIIGSIAISGFTRLKLRETALNFTLLIKEVLKGSSKIKIYISKGKAVYLPKIWIFILILSRRSLNTFACSFIISNLIGKHKIIDFTAAAKSLGKHNTLFSCRIYSVFNCFICHLYLPLTAYNT